MCSRDMAVSKTGVASAPDGLTLGTGCRKMLARDRKEKTSSGFREQKALGGTGCRFPLLKPLDTLLPERNLPPSTSMAHWFIQPMFGSCLLCATAVFYKGTR